MDRMAFLRRGLLVSLGFLAFAAAATPVLSKPARCFTTDDGHYDCDFKAIGGDGSFTISAPGKPTFTLMMEKPGVAFGTAVYEKGGRSVPLPDVYHRSTDDPACWINDATETQICAW